MFRFEKLEIWQMAIEQSDEVYRTTRSFPREEQFGLTSQVRRSAVSIAANIAEGSGRSSDGDFRRFLEIATGSLMETVSHLAVARRQNLLPTGDHLSLYNRCESLGKMLSNFKKRLQKNNP